MNIINLSKDQRQYVEQGAEILSLAFAEHWTGSWAELADGIEELETMTSGDNFCRIALIDDRVVGLITPTRFIKKWDIPSSVSCRMPMGLVSPIFTSASG